MGKYTDSLCDMVYMISPEDDDYKDKLIAVSKLFRTFDAALNEFILMHGFKGEISDSSKKIDFLIEKFSESDIYIDTRNIKKWFKEHKRGTNREIAFKFCFAFNLNVEETQEFFRKIYLQRGIDCHNIKEAIYYFCLKHRLSYKTAEEIISKAPENSKGTVNFNTEIMFTDTIVSEIDRFKTSNELLAFLHKNKEQFGYNNATAYRYINTLWEKISSADGIANREEALIFEGKPKSSQNRSVSEILKQITGLTDYESENIKTGYYAIKNDRTVQPVLKDNPLIHPIVAESFPDRQGIEGILRGVHQSSETVRKILILLRFYQFYASLNLKNNNPYYSVTVKEQSRCLCAINEMLTDAGYPLLYEGNPYDWIFMCSMSDSFPLQFFRFFMRELWLYKEENKQQ